MKNVERRLAELRGSIAEVEPGEAAALTEAGALIVDVREPDEIAQGSPAGALRIVRGFLELRIEGAVTDKHRTLCVLCAGGVRSLFAAEGLLALGYSDVRSMRGGFNAWKRDGLPYELPLTLTDTGRERYARHLLMPEVGETGQLRLLESRVLLIGAGGLGSPAAFYLAAAGVGHLGIVDDDVVDRSNLQRQILHTDDRVGVPKVESARRTLEALNPDVEIQCFQQRLDLSNAEELFGGWDVVFDGSDNFATRYVVNDACVKLGIPNVHGSIYRFEGQVAVFWPAYEKRRGPCYRCLYPKSPPPGSAPSCAEAGVLGVLPGVVGTLGAIEVIKLLLAVGDPLIGRLLHYDALAQRFLELDVAPDPACVACGAGAESQGIFDARGACSTGVAVGVRHVARPGTPFLLVWFLAGRGEVIRSRNRCWALPDAGNASGVHSARCACRWTWLDSVRRDRVDSRDPGRLAPRTLYFPTRDMPQALVGRQPIYSRDLEVFGYELLFRRDGEEVAQFTDGDAATSQVILSVFHEIGMHEVVGRRRAFVNLTRGFIVGEYPLPVPVEGVVLEILEHVEPDAEVLAGIAGLVDQGFTIALDDFVLNERTEAFLDLAHIVKIDVDAQDPETVERMLEVLRKRDVMLVAEQVRTLEDFESCLDLGFDLYQGFFLSRPKIVRGHRIPSGRMAILRLLARIMDPSCDLDELEHLIAQDVTLVFRLLRHINSASYTMPRRIESVRETVVYLGREQVRNLAGLFILSRFDDRPRELIVSAMLRGRMCELLAKAGGRRDEGAYFATGMLSTLDALLECPMPEAVQEIRLSEPVERALLIHEGELGSALGCVLAYERGEWERVKFEGVDAGGIKAAFLGAVRWADEVDRDLRDEAAA